MTSQGILESRQAFYSKAQYQLDTSHQTLEASFGDLLEMVGSIVQG
ncbi:MAG: hypothetical protein R3E95_09810 [Thiolinea sp.]